MIQIKIVFFFICAPKVLGYSQLQGNRKKRPGGASRNSPFAAVDYHKKTAISSIKLNVIVFMPFFLPHLCFQNYTNIYIYLPFVGFLHFRWFLFSDFCTIVDQNWTNQNHLQVHRNRVQLVWCHRRWSHQCKGISRFLNGFNQRHVKAVGD